MRAPGKKPLRGSAPFNSMAHGLCRWTSPRCGESGRSAPRRFFAGAAHFSQAPAGRDEDRALANHPTAFNASLLEASGGYSRQFKLLHWNSS
jgi:hypothetical protein